MRKYRSAVRGRVRVRFMWKMRRCANVQIRIFWRSGPRHAALRGLRGYATVLIHLPRNPGDPAKRDAASLGATVLNILHCKRNKNKKVNKPINTSSIECLTTISDGQTTK